MERLIKELEKNGVIYGEVTKDAKLGSIYTFDSLDAAEKWLHTEMYNFCERELLTEEELQCRYDEEIEECDGFDEFVEAYSPH